MKQLLWIVSIFVLLWMMPVRAQQCDVVTNAEDSIIAQKAQELVKDKPTRFEKLAALHAFVRDEIGQAKTQYG